MRILMLTQWFDPEPMYKGLNFARELIRRGHEIEVLTGIPNYPDGKIYDGYKIKPWQREEMDGIRVNRVALYPSHDNSGIRRIINYLSFTFTSLLLGPWLVRKPDVIYVYNLITLSWTAAFLRWLYNCRVVYDVQDLWPESVAFSGMLNNHFSLRFLRSWSLWAYRMADYIVVQSPGFKQNLMERGISDEKIKVIYNWSGVEFLQQESYDKRFARTLRLEKTFNVMFAGTMGIMQGLDTVLDAARICAESVPNVRFVLVGDGVEKNRLLKRTNDLGLDNVVFVPRQPMHDMGKMFALSDALLVHLKKYKLFEITIPSKTQAYLAAGRPIVMAVQGDSANLVEHAEAGVICPSEDPRAIAVCVEKLCNMSSEERKAMGKNGRNFYKDKLSFHCAVGKFDLVFKSIPTILE